MIDIHCHILPGVDDGSPHLDVSIQMIKKEIADGVKSLILTPHVQSRVQKVDVSGHDDLFISLKREVKKQGLAIDLYLGCEVFYRSHLTPNYHLLTLNQSNYVLVEFSTMVETPIEEIIYQFSVEGYIPIVAHVERYDYLTFDDYYKIKASGGLLQVNASAVLGLDHKRIKKGLIQKMIKAELIDFIATDAHNLDRREPNLKDAYEALKKQVSPEYLDKLFHSNALKIIT